MADEAEPRARIIEIGGQSHALGGPVSLELAQPFTVLVGRNGAGKSALLHLVQDYALQALGRRSEDAYFLRGNQAFKCTAEIDERRYRYSATSAPMLRDGGLDVEWSEECVALSSGEIPMWSTAEGTVSGLGTKFMVPPSTGLLALDPRNLPIEAMPVAISLRWLFRNTVLVRAGLPASASRSQIWFGSEPEANGFLMRRSSGSPRLDQLAATLMHWHQTQEERLARVQEVLRRIGICESLEFKAIPEHSIGLFFIDDHELHAASDGTLRVIEIIVALELAAAGALVMIEEPETGIHPGLCDGIMAEIEAAAEGLQLIISTHSPRILDRVQHHQLRHVRRNGSTRIDALTSEQVKEVKAFLDHQGTLSDYVFSPDFVDADNVEAD